MGRDFPLDDENKVGDAKSLVDRVNKYDYELPFRCGDRRLFPMCARRMIPAGYFHARNPRDLKIGLTGTRKQRDFRILI